jgi:peroxiredoxin
MVRLRFDVPEMEIRARALRAALPLVLAAGCATPGQTPGAPSRLPDFELNSIDGDPVRLSDHLGKEVIVLDFWATWCEPCKAEMPHLDRIYRAKKDRGLIVIAIAMDDPSTVGQVVPYVKESGYSFPVVLDPNGRASNLYNTHKSAPYMVIIGRNSTIVHEAAGFEPAAGKLLEERIEKILAGP